jgi:uncharacterized protein (TIRG00374 family)
MNWKAILGILISAIFLFLAFRKVHLRELRIALGYANYVYLIPSIILLLLSMLLRAIRWRYLLRPVKDIKLKSLFSATVVGLMSNNLLPARLGEIVRAYIIGEKERISKSSSFATIVVERIFDGLSVLFFFAVILILYAFSLPKWMINAVYVTIAINVIAILFLVLLKNKTNTVLNVSGYILRPFPERTRSGLIRILNSFVDGLKILHSAKDILASSILSILVWLLQGTIIVLMLISFDIHLPVYVSFLLLVSLCIGVMIPSAPGYIGTIQFVCVTILALFSVPKSQALSFSIVYHGYIFITVTLLGLIYLVKGEVSFRDIKKSIRAEK